jgi:hypothetical protein
MMAITPGTGTPRFCNEKLHAAKKLLQTYAAG